MHSGGPPLHYTVLPLAGMLAQLSPLAVLNNNGFTRKLQVQATLLQAAAAAAAGAARAAGATGAEDQIPKKSTSLFVWHCNIRAKVQLISECPFYVFNFPKKQQLKIFDKFLRKNLESGPIERERHPLISLILDIRCNHI